MILVKSYFLINTRKTRNLLESHGRATAQFKRSCSNDIDKVKKEKAEVCFIIYPSIQLSFYSQLFSSQLKLSIIFITRCERKSSVYVQTLGSLVSCLDLTSVNLTLDTPSRVLSCSFAAIKNYAASIFTVLLVRKRFP